MSFYVEPMLQLQGGKLIPIADNETQIKGVEAIDNASNTDGGIDMSADVKRLCKLGRLKGVLHILHVMDNRGISPNPAAYAYLLQECLNRQALQEGKSVHAHMIDTGFSSDDFLGNRLLIMYAKCGSLTDARKVFDKMPRRDVVSWNAVIAGYAQNGCLDEALKLFQKMPKRNVVSWTSMIASYSRHGQDEEALTLFYQMQPTGIRPNQFTFASVLPAFATSASLERGEEVHGNIIRSGFQADVFVERGLVDMYIKYGRLEYARKVFNKMSDRNIVSWTAMVVGYGHNGYVDEALKLFHKMPERDVISWTAMIAGYAQNGHVDEALKLFRKMPELDVVTWNVMIAGCIQNGRFDKALKLFKKMPERDVVSWNAIIAGYAQNWHVDEALQLFQKLGERDVISWNVMIAGYVDNGYLDEALKLLGQMQLACAKPDCVTFANVLPACANFANLEDGQKVHANIIIHGFQCDIFVGNLLVDMYAKCGRVVDACKVFDKMAEQDVASWNAMIAGYFHNGHVDDALNLFSKMPKQNVISWNGMIAGYAQNGHVDEALKLFQKMAERDVVSWTAMIAGYEQNGHYHKALKVFQQMQLTDVKASSAAFSSVLSACANLSALEQGKQVHENIIISGFHSDIFVGSTLVDVYAKCGSIEDACKIFDKMPERNVVSWNAMILGYAMHGYSEVALWLFEKMEHTHVRAICVTFIGVLSACCHAGLVGDGWEYFNCMSRDYHITPLVEHYCCMVDLLGRAGHLHEAEDFINKMPIKPNAMVWGSLLGACRIHTNVELGERVAERLFELEPNNSAYYVLLSNIYAGVGRWEDVEKVRKLMKDKMLKKSPGCSWIEVNNKVYSFLVKDRSHAGITRPLVMKFLLYRLGLGIFEKFIILVWPCHI